MTITEKTAYLKGLLEGLGLDKQTNEGKLFAAIIEALDDIAQTVAELDEEVCAINDEMDLIEETLEEIDGSLEEMDEDLDDLCEILEEHCAEEGDEDDLWDLHDDELEDEELWGEDEEVEMYQLTCPTCGEHIVFDEDTLAKGEMKCPHCGEDLEFDLSALEAEEDEDEESDEI